MRAVRVHEHGGLEVLKIEEIPTPEPGPGEVRVRVAWSALNHLDTWVRRGVEGHKFPLPITPGCDFSGVVDALGAGVSGIEAGQRVAVAPGFGCGSCRRCASGEHNLCARYGIYGETTDGGNAEFAVVRAENLLPVPDGFPLDLAAAFPLTFLTAWHMVVTRCGVQPGDRVLVHAAGSGVSVAATQIARLHGARVFVTAGSDEKVARGIENGAVLSEDLPELITAQPGPRQVRDRNFDARGGLLMVLLLFCFHLRRGFLARFCVVLHFEGQRAVSDVELPVQRVHRSVGLLLLGILHKPSVPLSAVPYRRCNRNTPLC